MHTTQEIQGVDAVRFSHPGLSLCFSQAAAAHIAALELKGKLLLEKRILSGGGKSSGQCSASHCNKMELLHDSIHVIIRSSHCQVPLLLLEVFFDLQESSDA